MVVLFWVLIVFVVYVFVGYALLLRILIFARQLFIPPQFDPAKELPAVSLLVAAYNEEKYIGKKIADCLELNYPKDKLQIVFVTDGSTDSTPDIVSAHAEVTLLHEKSRRGKMAAVERAIPHLTGKVIVFSDANTLLNRDALINLVKHYVNPKVGAVAGEKKIMVGEKADASSAGEGFYWKYESWLKKMDYQFYTNVGAAGELFSIRADLYQPIEADTIIDDHMIAMRIAEKGYVIAYEPMAYALENASLNSSEELKRKIRIAAGGIQSILRLKKAANPLYRFRLFFQYISHRVLRWTIVPYVLIMILIINILLVLQGSPLLYTYLLALQICFYAVAVIGWLAESRRVSKPALFVPYYFCLMNYAVIAGQIRYFSGKQSAAWEKSARKD